MSVRDRRTLKDSIYRAADLRERVASEIRKRPDVALNGVMLILAELYADGVADGDGFGMRSLVALIRNGSGAHAETGSDAADDICKCPPGCICVHHKAAAKDGT